MNENNTLTLLMVTLIYESYNSSRCLTWIAGNRWMKINGGDEDEMHAVI